MRVSLCAATIALLTSALPAQQVMAQAYPMRPITMIVPFPAGGPNDAIGRIVAESMRATLGQPVVMENVGGASGSLGVGRVARAAPDGYTLILGNWGTHVVNGAIYKLPYDVRSDFAPIAPLVSNPALIVARRMLAAENLAELLAWLKANPDTATMGVPGVGSAPHIYGLFFERLSGTRVRFIPYRGGAQVIQDLVAGQIDLTITTPVVSLAPYRAGSIKAYAVTARQRLPSAPEVPTAEEAGLPGYTTHNWTGLWAPKGTPDDVMKKLHGAVVTALADPSVQSKLAGPGQDIFSPDQQTPAALAALQAAEIEKWWPIIKAANVTGQ
jgi:tripartite-type tricarboxylate transporter receptor subunit TctC